MTSQLLFIGTTELLLIQGVQSFKKGMKEPLAEESEEDVKETKDQDEQPDEEQAEQ